MNLPNLYTLAALTLSIGAPIALAGCGNKDVGGDTTGQKSGSGGSGDGTGGSATASGGQAGSLSTGGVPGATGGTAGATGGAACGKNTCSTGQYCCDPLCGTCAPKGASCIQGCQVDPPPLPACVANSDCSVAADYCTGCNCRVLGPGGTIPACSGPGAKCDADPCMNTSTACENGICVTKKTVPPSGKCTTDADCSLMADYCTACDCRALAKGESLPKCNGPGVQCSVDACLNKTAACVNGVCGAR
jgi:hypothetical protein